MPFLNFAENAIWMNVLIFAIGAAAVWYAGTKLSAHVDLFADRTGLGKAFAGALLLGGATSLPEIATTLTAASSGAAKLAGTNLLGGVVMQLAVLALVDALLMRGKALTFFSPQSSLLMIGVMLIALIALASAAVSSGELHSIGGIGLWPVLLFAAYLISLWVVHQHEQRSRWEPSGELAEAPKSARDLKDAQMRKYRDTSTAALAGYFSFACAGVLTGGFFVARTGEALAEQTGLGQNIVGATLVALATSLPEVSTTWGAVRFGAYSMAAANILGTNSLEIALFLPADLAYRDGAVIDALDPSAGFLAAIGIVLTSLYLWGILERRDRTAFGMGWDSSAVLLVYVLGMAVYSTL